MFGATLRQRLLLSTNRRFLVASSRCCIPSATTTCCASSTTSKNNICTRNFIFNNNTNNNNEMNGIADIAMTPLVVQSRRFQATAGAASYKCSACGKTFRLPNALTHHIITKHGGEAKSIPLDAAGKALDGSGSGASGAAGSPPQSSGIPPPPFPSSQQQHQPTPATSSQAQQQQNQQQSPPTSSIPVPDPTGVPQLQQQQQVDQQATQQQQMSEEEFSKKSFVCHICQKSFRMEAALTHHYMAKHGIEQPGADGAAAGAGGIPQAPPYPSSSASSSTESSSPTSSSENFQTVSASDAQQQCQTILNQAQQAAAANQQQGTSNSSSSASSQQYQFHSAQAQQQQQQPLASASETVTTPLPPQYHLDVAPNAPEEREIAVHHNCVNNIVLMGAVQDATTGYVFEDRVLQFVVTTTFDNPSPGDPDRDFHTVRVYLPKSNDDSVDSYFGKDVAEQLLNTNQNDTTPNSNRYSKRVLVSGRLRMVPQYEPLSGRYYHFPVVQVQQGSGYVRCV